MFLHREKGHYLAQPKASGLIRDFLVDLHKSYLPHIDEMRKAARASDLSISTVHQAVTRGKGSAITHMLLFCYGLRIKPEALGQLLPRLRKGLMPVEKLSALDENIQRVLRVHTVDEVIVFLEMMLAKEKIERSLGLRKKTQGRPAKNGEPRG